MNCDGKSLLTQATVSSGITLGADAFNKNWCILNEFNRDCVRVIQIPIQLSLHNLRMTQHLSCRRLSNFFIVAQRNQVTTKWIVRNMLVSSEIVCGMVPMCFSQYALSIVIVNFKSIKMAFNSNAHFSRLCILKNSIAYNFKITGRLICLLEFLSLRCHIWRIFYISMTCHTLEVIGTCHS